MGLKCYDIKTKNFVPCGLRLILPFVHACTVRRLISGPSDLVLASPSTALYLEEEDGVEVLSLHLPPLLHRRGEAFEEVTWHLDGPWVVVGVHRPVATGIPVNRKRGG